VDVLDDRRGVVLKMFVGSRKLLADGGNYLVAADPDECYTPEKAAAFLA
jgi:hypothetical protein